MRLHDLRPNPGATKEARRVGRGLGSGLGKTAGKGHKGQKARSGGAKGPAFEGGQMPLARRLPKRGFVNIFKKEYAILNVGALNVFENGTEVTPEVLKKRGLVKGNYEAVKVLGEGSLEKSLVVKAHKFSSAAMAKIEAAGGKAEVI
ncbi:MAG TPA: 50S ribosomal protein L15 [Firmicutes bacterium]|nr:50S ribosomal protein L15 [Bacillota bacterium]